MLRLHAFLLTEIPSLIPSSANKHYSETLWGFMQFLRNVLGPQLSVRMHHVTTTLSENCNYDSKGQKVEKDNTDSITGSTGFTNYFFLFLSFLFLLIWMLFYSKIASAIFHLASHDRLPCFLPLSLLLLWFAMLYFSSQLMSSTCTHRTQCLNGPSAERLAKLIFLQMVKNHSFSGKQLL